VIVAVFFFTHNAVIGTRSVKGAFLAIIGFVMKNNAQMRNHTGHFFYRNTEQKIIKNDT
jgi:hypothetical protein